MLCIVNGKKKPNWDKVEVYGLETAKMIEERYPWYHKSPSIHTLLCHTKQVMAHRPLPPGYYTEGSQESYNRKDRITRLMHSRKTSREANIEDVFNGHMAFGDPVISNFMTNSKDMEYTNLPEYLELLDDMYLDSHSSLETLSESDTDNEDDVDDMTLNTTDVTIDALSDNEDHGD